MTSKRGEDEIARGDTSFADAFERLNADNRAAFVPPLQMATYHADLTIERVRPPFPWSYVVRGEGIGSTCIATVTIEPDGRYTAHISSRSRLGTVFGRARRLGSWKRASRAIEGLLKESGA